MFLIARVIGHRGSVPLQAQEDLASLMSSHLWRAHFAHLSAARTQEHCARLNSPGLDGGMRKEARFGYMAGLWSLSQHSQRLSLFAFARPVGTEASAAGRIMEASRGPRSQLVPIWVLTVFRVFAFHVCFPK